MQRLGSWFLLQSVGSIVVVSVLVCLLLAAIVGGDLQREYAREIEATGAQTHTLAKVAEEDVRQKMHRVELLLAAAAGVVQGSRPVSRLERDAILQGFKAMLPVDGLVQGLEVIDSGGGVVLATLPETPGRLLSAANRDYVASHRQNLNAGLLLGASLKDGPMGGWATPASIRLGPDGAPFQGVLVAWIDPLHFQSSAQSMDVGANGFVTVFTRQGWIIARTPAVEKLMTRSWIDTPMFKEHLPVATEKTVRQVVVADGVERIYSYRTLKDYPVVVSVGQSLTDALADWRERAWREGFMLLLVISGVGVTATLMIRQMRERRAAQSQLRLTALSVQKASVPIFWIARDSRIVRVNSAACDLHGYTEAELLRMAITDLDPDFPVERWPNHWADLKRRKRMCFETTQVNSKGQIVPVEVDLNFVEFNGEELNFAYMRDISARKKSEAELLQATDAAQAASQSKSQFLANMSHEIRTPMNAVLGMLKLFHNTELSDQQLDYATKAEGAAKSLLGLINDVLDFSKIDAGKMALDPHPFELEKLMRDLSVIVSTNVGPKPVEVLFDIDATAPKVLIGDAMRLQQVLINLSSNAIKFTAKGEVVIQVRVLARSGSEATLGFSVKDSGMGIAPVDQHFIFSGFSQAEASTTRRFGGTGLGLSISKRLVEMMGGRMELESALGEGSNFHFSVTLAVIDAQAVLAADGPPLTVLVVDDNATARRLQMSMAQSLGWQVIGAGDGAEAIQLVQDRKEAGQAPFQAVLMDWQMPGLDGWQTIAGIRNALTGGPIPIMVMVSINGREELSRRSPQELAQLQGFLVKPVTAAMLSDAVRDAQTGASNLRTKPRTKAQHGGRLRGIHLLVVEDNVVNQQVARELLAAEGALVEIADNGALGVAAVARTVPQFDAVLMDIQMPVMDGYAATRAIRRELGMADLPIIAMTANAMASDREACLIAGMNDHIGKPFDLTHLIEVLLTWTGRLQPEDVLRKAEVGAGLPSAVAPPALPAADAVDVDGALGRMGGNVEVYTSILKAYVEELIGTPDQLTTLLEVGDTVAAVRLLHSLKGLSATVGASYMAGVAKLTESAVRNQDAEALTPERLAYFKSAVDTTARVMGAIVQKNPSVKQALVAEVSDPSELAADLRELAALLRSADLRSLELHARIGLKYAGMSQVDISALNQAIADFDFEAGAALCDILSRQ